MWAGVDMGYVIRAVITAHDLLTVAAREMPRARLAGLRQGFALLPVTDVLFDAITEGDSDGTLGFGFLPAGFDRVLGSWSLRGAVAYVEAEYFGGAGTQSAAVWAGGALALGPLHNPNNEAFPAAGNAISQALRRLGVDRRGYGDEFDAVGLGRHRTVEDWIA